MMLSMHLMKVICTLFILQGGCLLIDQVDGNPDAKRLYDDLLSNYNRLIRPVVNNTEKLTVNLGLKLSQLMDVDLKNQIMTTNVWVEQSWVDYKLRWNPEDYGGVDMLYVPSQHIWLPDIVLFNNADGKYEVTLMTKASLKYTGDVVWKPPAIYQSSCKINVEWFPFDEQICDMKFGSWTYDGNQVDLKHVGQILGSNVVEIGIDLSEFYLSVEWDILEVPATRNEEFYSPLRTNNDEDEMEDEDDIVEEALAVVSDHNSDRSTTNNGNHQKQSSKIHDDTDPFQRLKDVKVDSSRKIDMIDLHETIDGEAGGGEGDYYYSTKNERNDNIASAMNKESEIANQSSLRGSSSKASQLNNKATAMSESRVIENLNDGDNENLISRKSLSPIKKKRRSSSKKRVKREYQRKLLTDITFYMTLRRKTLFYTVNLIIPCVGISFLTVLVFYLPSDSGEKVTLCISILLSLTVFFLLLAEIIPPTSLAVPLLGKYLLFTMILVTLSIGVTVFVLNVHFRSPATHRMSPWVRRIFIECMPRLLFMQRPKYKPKYSSDYAEKLDLEYFRMNGEDVMNDTVQSKGSKSKIGGGYGSRHTHILKSGGGVECDNSSKSTSDRNIISTSTQLSMKDPSFVESSEDMTSREGNNRPNEQQKRNSLDNTSMSSRCTSRCYHHPHLASTTRDVETDAGQGQQIGSNGVNTTTVELHHQNYLSEKVEDSGHLFRTTVAAPSVMSLTSTLMKNYRPTNTSSLARKSNNNNMDHLSAAYFKATESDDGQRHHRNYVKQNRGRTTNGNPGEKPPAYSSTYFINSGVSSNANSSSLKRRSTALDDQFDGPVTYITVNNNHTIHDNENEELIRAGNSSPRDEMSQKLLTHPGGDSGIDDIIMDERQSSGERCRRRPYPDNGNMHDKTRWHQKKMRMKRKRQMRDALKCVECIARNIHKTDKQTEEIADWKFMATVFDRFFLWLFTLASVLGIFCIILRAPSLYDMRPSIDQHLTEINKANS